MFAWKSGDSKGGGEKEENYIPGGGGEWTEGSGGPKHENSREKKLIRSGITH